MLVLSRKQSQSIVINGGIRVTVVSIRGNQVRIGIEAPESVAIFREELCEPVRAGERGPRFTAGGAGDGEFARGSSERFGHAGTPQSSRR